MESRTKRRLSGAELDGLARRALGAGVVASTELTDGYANAVWRLTLDDGREVVLKLAPPPDFEQLGYERFLLRTEAEAYATPRIQAIIDHERAFWGDPLAEFVTPTIFGDLEEDDPLLAGYREVTPLELTPAARVRLDLYRAYLYLIMLVENGPRQYPEREYAPVRDLVNASLARVLDRLARCPAR
ncbi:hypothetical protein NE235_21480 [Actinoallomurus spadix]|uniref:hypothetical protein n=1 Tax=Actinoallomurus spadix TaxID=79912 RepID=UPI0020929758|nr:hypothetical protein [Actinoallomurus spadix]MCO5988682.1 hypothetical protein [Actinoallomurus spadix]